MENCDITSPPNLNHVMEVYLLWMLAQNSLQILWSHFLQHRTWFMFNANQNLKRYSLLLQLTSFLSDLFCLSLLVIQMIFSVCWTIFYCTCIYSQFKKAIKGCPLSMKSSVLTCNKCDASNWIDWFAVWNVWSESNRWKNLHLSHSTNLFQSPNPSGCSHKE